MRIIVDGTRGRGSWCVRRTAAGRRGTFSTSPALRLGAEDPSSASARLRTRVAVGLVVAAAAFGAGSLAHAIPQAESSPADTSRTRVEGGTGIEGDRVVVFSNRPLPPAPQPADPATGGPEAPRILEVSFSIGNGPVRWYPPRRVVAVTVEFDRPVTVDTAGGMPLIDLVLGTHELHRARYASGSGSHRLTFHYATGDWDRNFNAATVAANTLSLNGARIDGSKDHMAANLAHAAGRLDNVRARSESAAATAAAPTLVALPPAAVRTPLPNLQLVAEPAPATGDRGAALAAVTARVRLRDVEPLLDLPLSPQAISGSRWTAPRVASAVPTPTGESSGAVPQSRATPAQDDAATTTSNRLRAAGTTPSAPYLWAWVEGQTRVRLQWNRGRDGSVTSHQIQVCEEAEADACEADDWTVLVAEHPQPPSPRGVAYTHAGLTAGSTRHYRVASRNANGLGEFSRVRSATTEPMPAATECATAVWSAYVTVATFGAYDDQGYRSFNGVVSDGALTDDEFSLGDTTYTVNQLWYSHDNTTPSESGRYYFPASYHFALSHYPEPDDKIEDLTLYVGETALPLSSASHTLQGFGEAFRWGKASGLWSETRVAGDPYKDSFNYADGDSVMVCLTDSAPNVSLVLTPASISEDGGVSTVSATITQGVPDAFEVSVSAEPKSPAVADDFTLSENTVLSFAANATTSSGTVTITAANNDVDAADKTIIVRGGLMSGVRPRAPQPEELTIEDDDAEPVLTLAVDPAAIDENGGTSSVVVSTGDTTFAAAQTITLTFTGSAEKDTDYGVSAEQLTLAASEHSVTATVTATDDALDEDDETILVSASHDGADVGTQQQITITDEDAEPELSITSPTVEEGESAPFEITLDPASAREVTVTYVTEDDTATAGDDYTALSSTTLTFAAGDTAITLTVATTDDTLHEATETFSVTLSAAANATLEGGGNTLSGTGTITDNDRMPEVSIADATTVTEGAAAEFEVSLDVTSGAEVTVTYATGHTDDTAQPPGDYAAVASAALTFAAGDEAKTIAVATNDDDLDEEDGETFTVTLSAPGNATLATDGTTATGTIDDNDTAPVLSFEDVTVVEDQDAEFVVSLGTESEREVTVSYATSDDTAKQPGDYTSASGTLTFEAGDTAKTITVTTEDDDLDEADSEQFKLTLSSAVNATLTGGQAALQKLGKITDNDDSSVLSLEEVTVTEGTAAEFEVSLNTASEREVTVSYATSDDTAEEPDDYTSASGTLTFEAGDTAKTITVTTEDDDLDEADSEQFRLTLSSAANATLTGDQSTLQKLGKITDNDGAPVLSLEDVTETEGDAIEFEVSLDEASGREVTVSYATADDTAQQPGDYTSASGTLTFEAGDTAKTITVTTEDDDLDEADSEQFKLTLSSAANATLTGGGATLQKLGKITDNDDSPVLSLEEVTVTEDTDAEFEVSLDEASGREVTVTYATADDTAQQPDDYASASGTLTFEAGDTAKTITVTTEDDDLDEADSEQFKLTLSSAANATLTGGQSTLQKLGKITDNDGAPVLSLEDVTATEGDDIEFEVSLNTASGREVTVTYATADDTAQQPDDYASASGTLTFEAGDTAKTITVTTEDDDLDEADSEQFKLTLSSAANATLTGDQSTLQKLGKITDNDGAPVLSLEDVTATEGDDIEFEVSLNTASGREVTVTYATSDDTAEEPDDYASASGTLTFEAGDTAKTITVTTEDDDLDEADSEQFKLTLSSAVNATLAGGQATLQKLGKITDNDDSSVLSLEEVTVTEGTAAEFEVSLNTASEREVTVSYATSDDTAEEPDDYASASGTLTFEAGDTAKTITVTTEDDDLDEADSEQFRLTLSSAANATLTGDQSTLQKLGKITDNDGAPVLSLEDVTETEGDAIEFEVSLDEASGREVTVSYATADDTARQPGDYTTASGTLTFEAGDTAKTITVAIVDDTLDEEDTEQFKLTLSSAANATLAGGQPTAAEAGQDHGQRRGAGAVTEGRDGDRG